MAKKKEDKKLTKDQSEKKIMTLKNQKDSIILVQILVLGCQSTLAQMV